MDVLKVICWTMISITRIRFPPGKSLATTYSNNIVNSNTIPVPLALSNENDIGRKNRSDSQGSTWVFATT